MTEILVGSTVPMDQGLLCILAVGDHVPHTIKRAAKKPGRVLPVRIVAMTIPGGDSVVGVDPRAVGHAHAKDDVRLELHTVQAAAARRNPVSSTGWRATRCTGWAGGVQGPAGSKSKQCSRGRRRKTVGEQHGLPLGAAAAEEVLDHEDFHCPERWAKKVGTFGTARFADFTLNPWASWPCGVTLATKLVPGITW